MDVRELHDMKKKKRRIAVGILEALPEWFGFPKTVEY